jgi:hypothetical protein
MLRCRWILSDYGPFTWIKDMIYKKNTLYKTRQKWVGMEKFKFDHIFIQMFNQSYKWIEILVDTGYSLILFITQL